MTEKLEFVTVWTLSATVLRAENIAYQDILSAPDCYVTLKIPMSSPRVCRTKSVANNQNPEWNETFFFPIDKGLKNMLEMKLFDEDPLKSDNCIISEAFDISGLIEGKKETMEIILKDESNAKIFLDLELQRREKKIFKVATEPISYWTLNVTVVKASIKTSLDYFSQSDCYVILTLPTATARTFRTKTISNSNNPEWNETFTFRVPSHIKNIMNIKMYDEDPLARDDLISTLLFDVSSLTLGKKETRYLLISTEEEDELVMDFELLSSEEPAREYLSNGVLVAAPFTALDVTIDRPLSKDPFAQDKVLKLRGAFEESQPLSSTETKKRFYVNRDLETELGVVTCDYAESAAPMGTSVKLKPLQANHEEKVSLSFGQDTVDLDLRAHDSEAEHLAVRLEYDIPVQEKEYLKKRKPLVGQALQKLLGLSSPPEPNKVPTIAVVGSGGGTRAMTGLCGGLRGLKELGILDAVTYITGVSGSTWTMSSLYQNANWSHEDMNSFISSVREKMSKPIKSGFSAEKLSYYKNELEKKADDGHLVSFIDMWGLVIEHLVFEKKMTSTLSEQQRTVNEGQNPFPIYTAVNMKDGIMGCVAECEWCEFTPYEVGLEKYGAYIPTEDFGSSFFLGHIIQKLPEIRLPFLMGIWSSAFSINLTQLWGHATGSLPSWTPWLGPDISNIEVETDTETMDTYLLTPTTGIGSAVTNFFRDRPVVAEVSNFMRGLFLHWNYSKNDNFTTWKENHPDAFPSKLTPSDSILHVVDAGHAINIACSPVLRPERDVDLIISLSYSWDPHRIFNVISKTAAFCEDHKIPFPNADFASLEKEPQKEMYIFEDKENPKAPIVIHFPLGNITYKNFKAPGVPRETEEEIKAGQVDVTTRDSPYHTSHLTYAKEDFDALADLITYNVINNKESLLETIRKVTEKKASKK